MSEYEGEKPTADPEAILDIKERIFEAWALLPPQHRATITMVLTVEVLKGEWGEWLKGAVAIWREQLNDFPFTAVYYEVAETSDLRSTPKEHNFTDFDEWMREVDKAVWQMIGCSVYDLPDYNFRSMFEDEVSPTYAADQALIDAGFSRFE